MADLKNEKPVHATTAATPDEIQQLNQHVPGWEVIDDNGEQKLRREFRFDSYLAGVDFAVKVGQVSEEQDHHPMIVIDYKKVTVYYNTHSVNGLHRNDFIMAARVDAVGQA